MKRLLSSLLYTTVILAFIWGMASYIEIICKNTSPNPKYSEYNIIVNLVTYADERID